MYIFILDISYQHLGNTCLLNLYTGIVSVLDGFPNTSLVLVEYGHSLIINLSTGSGVQSVDQEILPREQERIVKINPSLLMMRECRVHNEMIGFALVVWIKVQ